MNTHDSHSARNGKIAHFPAAIRQKLSQGPGEEKGGRFKVR
ncbi:MAG: hypothetical protein ABJF10_17405 [Chthoniobacter sp.]